ncbi:hypothetical protein ACFL2U_03520 [Patescibacteria group bacterium]
MPFGPDPSLWDEEMLFLRNLIIAIDMELLLKVKTSKKEKQPIDQITVSFERGAGNLILDKNKREWIRANYLKAGWDEVEVKLWQGHWDEPDEIEPLTERQLRILQGEEAADEHERPIPAHWQVILKKNK